MLNRVESKIMDYMFERCDGKKTVLLTPKEILQSLLPKYELTAKQLDGHIKNLAIDGYVEVFNSDNKGQLVYVAKLKTRGEAWHRERAEASAKRWRSIGWKLMLTAMGLVISLTFWLIMR